MHTYTRLEASKFCGCWHEATLASTLFHSLGRVKRESVLAGGVSGHQPQGFDAFESPMLSLFRTASIASIAVEAVAGVVDDLRRPFQFYENCQFLRSRQLRVVREGVRLTTAMDAVTGTAPDGSDALFAANTALLSTCLVHLVVHRRGSSFRS